ncbi:hypothetical protein [Nostoc sp. UHCC 0252]|uniref:hypothetical protein n=1 Tax=Nostoc sp. UHCC 0252 TaxID=3110241 RepID=UPI002B1EAD2A|nr:hypothetical protein [Nostoc sp. UHCC 0252]MEA5603700.1 hypothetical protein [Nostoc sp. UHCC 0252]
MPNKAFMLTQVQRDFLVLLLSIQPHLSKPQMTALFKDKFEVELTEQQLKTLITKTKKKVEELQKNESLTLELAIKVGLVSLHSKINRTLALEEIVRMAKDGYVCQTQSAKGEVVSYIKHELKTATEALKALKAEWSEDIQQQANYTIVVGDAQVPQVEELEGDDEL